MLTRLLILLSASIILSSCQAIQNQQEEHDIQKGDIIAVVKPLTIPEDSSYLFFQKAEIKKRREIKLFSDNCTLEKRGSESFKIPAGTYAVSKINYYEDMYSDAGATIRYATEIYLDSADYKNDLILTCQVLDSTMQYHAFSVEEIKRITGDYLDLPARADQ